MPRSCWTRPSRRGWPATVAPSGGCPGRVIIDNAKCAITNACMHSSEVQRSYAALAERYGFRIDVCPPHDLPKKKIVESGVKYVKKSFVPLRTFRDLSDANW